ncbi:MAG TPA: hypothetical protein VKR99_02590 [Candidatus Eremiobacteraceae bacterium]|nr:hypothetical protein [Candidatus Eremiobacteraceae bacterium]
MQHERFQSVHNGRRQEAERVEIEDTIVVETDAAEQADASAEQREFEVVGIVEDADSSSRYAVCYSESMDEFIVTDEVGALLSDEALAQEVLDDFLQQAADTAEEGDA